MLNISHSIYPDKALNYNEIMNLIYNRTKIEDNIEKDIKVNRVLGYFEIIKASNINNGFITKKFK